MHDGSVLDLAHLPEFARGSVRKPMVFGGFGSRTAIAITAVIGVAVIIAGIDMPSALRRAGMWEDAGGPAARMPLDELRKVETMTVDDKSQIVAEGQDAERRNAALPASATPIEHVRRFMISAATNRGVNATALTCLTQAVYYEAAYEPLQGRRAVAQVVLNRMRHPAYPKSVCGVVYQGSERRTGCQFSFTCDGSLLRSPSPHAWQEAQGVARAALAGYVEASVGTATHYHADYVLPRWAFQLGKIAQFGRHIFYRFNGNWGRSSAFSGQYSGIETIPAINFDALNARLAAGAGVDAAAFQPGLTVAPHVTDRHSDTDVGGRLDMTKEWRLNIPDPAQASSHYHQAVASTETQDPISVASQIALAAGPADEASQ